MSQVSRAARDIHCLHLFPLAPAGDQIWPRPLGTYLTLPIYNTGDVTPAYLPWQLLHGTEDFYSSVVLHVFFKRKPSKQNQVYF